LRARAGVPAGALEIAFLSPQQLEGKPADARADVFALGVIAYGAVTGRDPFGDTAADAATRLAAIEKGPTDPAQYVPALTDHVRSTLQIALARNLTERFADALTMRAALRGDSQVALDTPTLKWAVPEGAPPGEVTEGMAAFLSDEAAEPDAGAPGETNAAPED
jgi:serine/threonine protein kinase